MRSCYTTQARFFSDRPDLLLPITWYFTSPKAAVYDKPHRFGSLNWLPDRSIPSPIGEVAGVKRAWSNGAPPAGANLFQPCGDEEAFYSGVTFTGQNFPILGGVKACCVLPQFADNIGIALGVTDQVKVQ